MNISEVRTRVAAIQREHDAAEGSTRMNEMIFELYHDVLEAIARGGVNSARALATEALKLEDGFQAEDKS